MKPLFPVVIKSPSFHPSPQGRFGRLAALGLLLIGCRLMALPETQRESCAGAVHGWHLERIEDIDALQVPVAIKAEMAAYSRQTEERQLEEICDIEQQQLAGK